MIESKTEYRKFAENITEFNEVLAFLKKEVVDQLPLNLDEAATTSANCAFIFEWVCRSYLGRAINLAENYALLINNKQALASALIGRALIETVSHFHLLLSKVEHNLKSKNYAKVYYLLSRFMLGGDHDFKSENKKVKKIHVNDSLESLDKTIGVASDSYNWLSEFCHPNSLGTTLLFSRMDKFNKTVSFTTFARADENFSPAFEGIIYFHIFQDDWRRSIELEKAIATEWQFSEEIFDMYE